MEGYKLDMKSDLTMLKHQWPEFYRVSGKDFWKAQGGKPYVTYIQVLNNVRNTLNRLKQNLKEHYDERVRAQLYSEGRPGVAYIETLNNTIEECPCRNSANNQEPLRQLKECVDILTEIQGMDVDRLRVCRKCGRALTIDHYYRNKRIKDGYCTECKECYDKRRATYQHAPKRNVAVGEKPVAPATTPATTQAKSLQDYTPRELMAELARRGYTGKLEYVERHIIDITNF